MNNELINVFTQIPTHIFWKDVNSVFLGCNNHFAQAAGLTSPQEIQGKTDFDLAWENYAELYREGDREVLDGKIQRGIIEPQLQANGKKTHIILNKIPFYNKSGNKIGVMGSFIEMHEPKYHGSLDPNKKNISLTSKQMDCLAYLAKGMTAKQIALAMQISTRTVESHIEAIKSKLKSPTKADLIKKAWKIDIIKMRVMEL